MALAALCVKAKFSILDNEQVRFRAFVVDHAARPSSSEESRQVVQILEDNSTALSIMLSSFFDFSRYPESSSENSLEKPTEPIRPAKL
jgi:hypothetical protein